MGNGLWGACDTSNKLLEVRREMQTVVVTGWEPKIQLLGTGNAEFLDENLLHKYTVNIHRAIMICEYILHYSKTFKI